MRQLILMISMIGIFSACRNAAPPPSTDSVHSLITTTPSATELVAALGFDEFIVGVDRYSTYPSKVADKPKVGDFMAPNLEAITRLKPSLVVMDQAQSDAATSLKAAGIKVLLLSMHTIDDVKSGLSKLGDELDQKTKADKVIASIDQKLSESKTRANTRSVKTKILVVVDRAAGQPRSVIAAGPESYFDQLIGLVGGENNIHQSSIRYPNLSAETILRNKPDIIFDVSQAGSSNPGDWKKLPGMESVPVHVLKGPYFLSPSPRIGEALAPLHQILDQFEQR